MLKALRNLFIKWFAPAPIQAEANQDARHATCNLPPVTCNLNPEPCPSGLVPFDETLLERARIQWQFGDWENLAKIDRDPLQHHPDRAKLALLAAAGRLQTGNNNEESGDGKAAERITRCLKSMAVS